MAKTSRPSSRARSQVIKLPDRNLASATMTPWDNPAIMRLRFGKWYFSGAYDAVYSLKIK